MKSHLTINTLFEEKVPQTKDKTYPILLSAIMLFKQDKLAGIELEYQHLLPKFNRKSHGCYVQTEGKKIIIANEYSKMHPELSSHLNKAYKVFPPSTKYFSSIQFLRSSDNKSLESSETIKTDQIIGILSFLQRNNYLSLDDQALLIETIEIDKIEKVLSEGRENRLGKDERFSLAKGGPRGI